MFARIMVYLDIWEMTFAAPIEHVNIYLQFALYSIRVCVIHICFGLVKDMVRKC